MIFLFCVREVGGFGGSLHSSLPKEGEVKSFLLSQNDHVQFLTFSSNTHCGVFCLFVFSQAARNTGCGMEGGILPVPMRNSLLTGLREFLLSVFPSLPLLVRPPTSSPNTGLQRIRFRFFFFLTCRNILFCNLSPVLSY